MTGVFINYRTHDGGQAAALLHNRLRDEFGDGLVFLDSAALQPGVVFPSETLRRLDECTVLLAVIGSSWLSARLTDPDDFLRREIEIALSRRIHVIPVLLDDAKLPDERELPESIRELPRRQAVRLRSRGYDNDLRVIVEALAQHLPRRPRGDSAGASQISTITIKGDGIEFHAPITGISNG